MHVKSLKLRNFRNYSILNIDFNSNFNIICGDNAQGKTNILEAVFMCASGRSHRTSRDAELVKNGEDGFYVKLDFDKTGVDSSTEISYKRNEKKQVRINEIKIKRFGEMIGHFNSVIFSPEDLQVIKEGPAERRRFLDITLCQLKPSYFFDLQQYIRILAQRNNLLKKIQQERSLADTLEIWNDSLVKTGSRIIKARNVFIRRLAEIAEKSHYLLTDGKEKLTLVYSPSIDINKEDSGDYSVIEDEFRKMLVKNVAREIICGITLVGPQRDDYDMFLDGMNLKMYGSQGQQRTVILSIKLSEIELLKEERGKTPVLLLDDVMSELDGSRQKFLMENLGEIQVFITCTDPGFFKNRTDSGIGYFVVKQGEIYMRENNFDS